jgi:hypothetical protein
MGSIPLPALAVQPPPQTDPLQNYGKVLQMKSLLQNQQAQQQEIQIRQQQLTDQQAMTAALKGADPTSPTFYDDVAKGVLKNGGSGNAALQVQQHALTVKKTISDIAASDAATSAKNLETFIAAHKTVGDALQGIEAVPDDQLHDTAVSKVNELATAKVLDPQTAQKALQVIQNTSDPTALRAQIDVLAKNSMGAKAVAEQQQTSAATNKDAAQAAEANAQAAFTQLKLKGAQMSPGDIHAAVTSLVPNTWPDPTLRTRTESLMNQYRAMGQVDKIGEALSAASQEMGAVAKETNPAVQQGKVNVATAEGRARQLVEGMEKPVYAIDPQTGQKSLMSATDAVQAGIRTMLPVGAKEVGDDTQLINRLGDVRQKIAQYEQNMSKLGTTVSAKDQGNIAALIGSGKFSAGAFGTEIPLDRLNAALQKENISGLSDDAKKLLVSYYNARESMQGYQRVLSGTGRANEKAMQLNLDALPNPATSDPSYAAESLKQFKQNLQIVGQGLPKIPGVKSPEEIEAQTNTPAAATGGTVKMKAPDGTVKDVSSDQVQHYKALGATVVP